MRVGVGSAARVPRGAGGADHVPARVVHGPAGGGGRGVEADGAIARVGEEEEGVVM